MRGYVSLNDRVQQASCFVETILSLKLKAKSCWTRNKHSNVLSYLVAYDSSILHSGRFHSIQPILEQIKRHDSPSGVLMPFYHPKRTVLSCHQTCRLSGPISSSSRRILERSWNGHKKTRLLGLTMAFRVFWFADLGRSIEQSKTLSRRGEF